MMINENTKVRLGYLGTIEGKDMYENARNNPESIIDLYEGNEPDDKKQVEMNRDFFKVNKDVYAYYFFKRTNGVDIFVEMPLVTDNELFKWTRRDFGHKGRVKTMWTCLKKGFFKINCTYYLTSKDVQINIIWNERHKEHLSNIWLKNATNEDILAAIREWVSEFEGHVMHSVETAILENAS